MAGMEGMEGMGGMEGMEGMDMRRRSVNAAPAEKFRGKLARLVASYRG
jgi:hypothetical protein